MFLNLKNMCKSCKPCKTSVGQYVENLKGKRLNNSKYHYVTVAVTLAVVCSIFIRDVAEEGQRFLYNMPHEEHFSRQPSIFLTSLEFGQEDVQEHKQNMAYQMDYSCEATSNDVIFSFQYIRSQITNKSYNDHIFMLCKNHRAFGNSEIVYESNDKILCTEEYAGTLMKKKRSANITIKAIDIQKWKPVQYDSADHHEACSIGHAIDMLNNVWK